MLKRNLSFILISLVSITCLCAQNQQESKSETAQRMKQLGIVLPQAPLPVGSYVTYKKTGNLIFINQVALVEGKILTPGIVGKTVSEEDAKQATRQTMLNILAILQQALDGNLDKVKQAVQMTGIFNTEAGYTKHALLMNEASALLTDVLGERGVHTRATFGAISLPIDSPVEIQAIFEVE